MDVTLTFDLVTLKLIGVICWWWPTCTPSMKFLGPSKNYFSAHRHCDLSAQGHCDLDFRRTDLKTNRGLLLGMANLHTKYGIPRPKHSSVIVRKPFFTSQGHHDLDLWPSVIKITRGQLLVMTNLHTKYEVPMPKHSSVIERKQVWQTEGRNGEKTICHPHVWGRHNYYEVRYMALELHLINLYTYKMMFQLHKFNIVWGVVNL